MLDSDLDKSMGRGSLASPPLSELTFSEPDLAGRFEEIDCAVDFTGSCFRHRAVEHSHDLDSGTDVQIPALTRQIVLIN